MNYATKIPEELDFLLQAEKQRGSALDRDRIRFLRLLKSGQCATQAQAGVAIGLGERQAQRLWKTYQQAGLQGLMSQPARRGWGKLSSFQITQLRQFLLADQPKLNSESFGWLVSKVEASREQKSLFIADGATAHKNDLFDSQKLVFERLPAACPELNPVERFFKEVRKQLKNKVFDSLQQAQERIQAIVEQLFAEEGKVISLTCFPYLKNKTSQI